MQSLNAVQLKELAASIRYAAQNYFRLTQEIDSVPYRCDNGLITHSGQFVKAGNGSIGVVATLHPLVILWQNGHTNSPMLSGVNILTREEVSRLVVAAWMDKLPEEMIQDIKDLRNEYNACTGNCMGLKDAKDIVDAINRGEYPPADPPAQKAIKVLVSCVIVEE